MVNVYLFTHPHQAHILHSHIPLRCPFKALLFNAKCRSSRQPFAFSEIINILKQPALWLINPLTFSPGYCYRGASYLRAN